MASEVEKGLFPLRREYDQAWHGFDRTQVHQYLDHVETHLRRILADREASQAKVDTLARELEKARGEILQLRNRVAELLKPPERLEDLDERMQRGVQLAMAQAEDITKGARIASEQHWTAAVEVSTNLRERYQTLLTQLDTHAEALHAEHESALEATKAEVAQLTGRAAKRREELDAAAERKRRSIEREFDSSMASQRAALEKYIADQQTACKNQAERRIAEATAEAKRRIDEATTEAKQLLEKATSDAKRRTDEANEQVEKLHAIRDRVGAQLADATAALERGEAALKPIPAEATTDTSVAKSEKSGATKVNA